MEQGNNSNALTWVLGGALLLIGLFVAILLVSVNSQADSVTTQTVVTNVAPTVDTLVLKDNGATVAASGTLTLNAGTTEAVTITGTVSDDNGVATSFASGDLADLEGELYVTSLGVGGCASGTTDNNSCYFTNGVGNCVLGSVVDSTTLNYTCSFSQQYYADGTLTGAVAPADTWTASVKVVDDSALSATSTQLYEIGTLLALSIPGSINYGTLAREASTTNTNNQEMTITQYGNDGADVEVSGTTMPCTVVGTVPIANQKWSLTDLSAASGAVTALTGSAVDSNFAISYRTSDAGALTKILYWNIIMPAVATGTCSGTNTITSIAS